MQPPPMTLSVMTASVMRVEGRHLGKVYIGDSLSKKLL